MAFYAKQSALGERQFLINSTSLKTVRKVEVSTSREKTRFADRSAFLMTAVARI